MRQLTQFLTSIVIRAFSIIQMAAHSRDPSTDHLAEVTKLLGGAALTRQRPRTPLEAHELIRRGFPGATVQRLQVRVGILRDPEMLRKATGMSLRTTQRKAGPEKDLDAAQSGRLWKFAEILTWATEVLGSQEEAERWLLAPALALSHQAPIDLLSTPAGVEMVEDLLTRIQYGVYT